MALTTEALPDFRAIDHELEQAPSDVPAPPVGRSIETVNAPPPASTAEVPLPDARPNATVDGRSAILNVRAVGAATLRAATARRVVVAVVVVVCALSAGLLLRRSVAAARGAGAAIPAGRTAPAGELAPAATGTATFASTPGGVEVRVAGGVRGKTPLTLTLPPGDHVVELGSGAARRSIPVSVGAGTVASYYVELPQSEAPPSVGRLEVLSDPPGAPVMVDGVRRGNAPLALTDVAAGDHRVTITQNGTAINRNVRVVAGSTVSVVASSIAGAAGWIAIAAPFEMRILERGSQIGTTASRIMVPAGAHRFDLVNSDLDYTTSVAMTVTAGGTATATVTPPNGLLSINARPWAEVLIDGKPSGTTPLGNVMVVIGAHEIVLRHPQLGERRRTVTVKPNVPARIGVDFNQ